MTGQQHQSPEAEAVRVRNEAASSKNDTNEVQLADRIFAEYHSMPQADQKRFTKALQTPRANGSETLPIVNIETGGSIKFDTLKNGVFGSQRHDITTVDTKSGHVDHTTRVDNKDGSTMTTYSNGTVETHEPDGSANWITSDAFGYNTTMSMDAKGKVDRSVANPNTGFFYNNDPNTLRQFSLGRPGNDVTIKVPGNANEFLTIPTRIDTGVEDKQNWAANAPNYFADAWNDGRAKVAELWNARNLRGNEPSPVKPGEKPEDTLPRDFIGLALNSEYGRSQNQLHIHADVVPEPIRNALSDQLGNIDKTSWTPLNGALSNFKAKWIDAGPNGELVTNPVDLVHDTLPGAAEHMNLQGIGVIGQTKNGRPGFVVLVNTAHDLDTKHADWGISANLVGH